jgi:predicted ATP-dependent endonuclease of OLD family
LFVDEPEAGLHPEAITQLVEMLWGLSQNGMQIFLSTHSYFVLKKLQLLAQQHRASAPVLSLEPDGYAVDDLRDGMPDNPIVQTSIDLYRQELQLEA